MSETPKFIALIENYECLWKKSFRNNLECRRQAWDEIAEKMYGCNWKSFSTSEKVSAKAELQKKWKNIKDCFIKELKHQQYEKSGVLNKKKSKYMFFDSLMFLYPEVDTKTRNRFKLIDGIDSYSNSTEQESLKEDNSCDTYNFENGCESPPVAKDHETTAIMPKAMPVIGRRPNKQKLTSVQFRSRLLRILAQQKNDKPNCAHDEDESFFHSLLPLVRKLDEQQKIQFRMEVLNSLRNLRNFNSMPQQALNVGNMGNQSYYPVTQHQLQIYSLPPPHAELSSTNSDDHSQQNSNVVSVSNSSQLQHVSITNGLGERKNQDVQVFSNVL